MTQQKRICLICDCEKSMPLDAHNLSLALGSDIDKIHTQLCRSQLPLFEKALDHGAPVLVACTQEAPLFQEIADERQQSAQVDFVNIREMAGWSDEGARTTAKIAALVAYADYKTRPARLKSIRSDGMCLVYGAGELALEAARLLSSKLSVTLLLSRNDGFMLPALGDIPIYRGDIVHAHGSFGDFSVTVDHYAPLMPSSRGDLKFMMAQNGAKSSCSVILDLSGKAPLLTSHQHRDGYLRVDPGDPAAVLRAAFQLSEMAGEFEKPIYVETNPDLCAHARSKITGCSKCLDTCPAGAISEAGDHITVDSGICGGCGSCHAVCPTDAVSYHYPHREDFIGRTQAMLSAYMKAGGTQPALLLYDEVSGSETIAALARFGRGLPANMLPVPMHSASAAGHVEFASMIASGAVRIIILGNPQRKDELAVLASETSLANHIVKALDLGDEQPVRSVIDTDPDVIEAALWAPPGALKLTTSSFSPTGSKRDIARMAFAKLHEAAPGKPGIIALPIAAPYGQIQINASACTLCMACTSACPTGAMMDTPGEPRLRFLESACVQCNLCVKTCPENALTLDPRLNLTSSAMQPVTLHEEEPFDCIVCGKAFATRSTINHIKGQLAGNHAMFADEERTRIIEMCQTCRVEAMANSEDDPFSLGARPKVRTTQDYLDARKDELTADDFLKGD